jgi:hypothetical protein
MYKVVFVALRYDGHASPVPLFIPDFTFPLCLDSSGEGGILSMLFLLIFHHRSSTDARSNTQAISRSASLSA